MVTILKDFIKNNFDLINNNKFVELYYKARVQIPFQIGNLSYNLMQAGIQPLNYVDRVVRNMFSDCTLIDKITIPPNCIGIEKHAFQDWFGLIEVTLPATLQWIDNDAFANCYDIEKINFEGTIEQWQNVGISVEAFLDGYATTVNCIDGVTDLPTNSVY